MHNRRLKRLFENLNFIYDSVFPDIPPNSVHFERLLSVLLLNMNSTDAKEFIVHSIARHGEHFKIFTTLHSKKEAINRFVSGIFEKLPMLANQNFKKIYKMLQEGLSDEDHAEIERLQHHYNNHLITFYDVKKLNEIAYNSFKRYVEKLNIPVFELDGQKHVYIKDYELVKSKVGR